MSIPTHDSNCVTKAYPTKCHDCDQNVWFFSCNCGSKVYFDELGYPWQFHDCKQRRVREALELIQDVDRLSGQEIYDKVDQLARERGWEVPDEMVEILDFHLGRRKTKLSIAHVTDLSSFTEISGKVMMLDHRISFKSRLKIDLKNPIAVGLAGDLIKHDFAELTIRENPDKRNVCREFKVLVREKYLKKNPIKRGSFLLALIKPISNKISEYWEIIEHKCY